ncbi:MAG TPA: YbaK/EbsC family protein [Candidatus Limnocylindria bacterium]
MSGSTPAAGDPGPVHANIQRVTAHAAAHGIAVAVRRFAGTTRTAEDAAARIGCDVAAIVKSLVFLADGAPVVALCSGADRVDVERLRQATGAGTVRRATADEVKAATGFPIGGVAPFGHRTACAVFADQRLLAQPTVWAAAGLPDAVFEIAPEALVRASGGHLVEIASRS